MPNPSIEATRSGLRPPRAPHVKRSASNIVKEVGRDL